jgi:hypothetical protein
MSVCLLTTNAVFIPCSEQNRIKSSGHFLSMLSCSHRFDVNGVEYLRAPTESFTISDPKFDGVVDSNMLELEVPIIERGLELTRCEVWMLEVDEIFRQCIADTFCAIIGLKLIQADLLAGGVLRHLNPTMVNKRRSLPLHGGR